MRVKRSDPRRRLRRMRTTIALIAAGVITATAFTVTTLIIRANQTVDTPTVQVETADTEQETTETTPTKELTQTPTTEPIEVAPPREHEYTEHDVELISKTVYGEANNCSNEERALVIWTILNRVEAKGDFRNQKTIEDVILHKGAFHGYDEDNPVTTSIRKLVEQELEKWCNGEEAPVVEPYATTPDYLSFEGDGKHNWFREEW